MALKIKCPNCGALLKIVYKKELETKKVKCPVCHTASPFTEYKKVDDEVVQSVHSAHDDNETHYPGGDNGVNTVYGGVNNGVIGALIMPNGLVLPLKSGKNVIGRDAKTSNATIKIPGSAEIKMLSREHIIIDVNHTPGSGFVHQASLYKIEVNETKINGNTLNYADSVILSEGSKIELPGIVLTFVFPDEEKTQFQS